MVRGMLLAAVSVAVVLGAEPQCPDRVDLRSCVAGYDSGRLSLAMNGPPPPTDSAADVRCRPEAQAHRDSCHSTCALRLVVTSPAEYAFSACVQDNVFEPYVASAHIDESHPLRKQELEFVHVKGGGCDPTLWSREKHEGKLVLLTMTQGGCPNHNRIFPQAETVGAAAVLLLGLWSSMWDLTVMVGPSGNVPAAYLGAQFAEVLAEAESKGLVVKGYFDLACDASPATPPPTLPVTDNCPSLSLVGKCSNQAEPAHRLCNRCPQQLSWGGKSVCLWGNGLVPRDGRNHLRSVLSLPAEVTAVYIESSTRVGCTLSEYSDVAGTIVFVKDTGFVAGSTSCTPFSRARLAQQAGAVGYVSITPREAAALEVQGPSHFVTIPVHTTMPSDYYALRNMFHAGIKTELARAGGAPPLIRYMLNAGIVDDATADVYTPVNVTVAEEAARVVVDELASFDWTPAVIVSLVVIIVMTVLIGWKLHQQHSQSVVLPAESVADTFTVPLSVASMGLSISLVLIIAAVAFSLAHTAGQSATDTALDDGHTATMQTYRSAQDNAADQASQITGVVTDRVMAEVRKHIETGERAASSAAKLYIDTDPSWNSWVSMYQLFIDSMRGYCCKNSLSWTDDWREGWTVSMLSVSGYFTNHKVRTDTATASGLTFNIPLGPNGLNIRAFPVHGPGATDSPATRIGQWPGDRRAAVTGQRAGHNTWMLPRDSLPFGDSDPYWYPPNPVSVLTPVYSRVGDYLGVVEAMMDVGLFVELLEEALPAELGNVSIVIFDLKTLNLVVDTNKYYSRVVDQYYTSGSYIAHHQLIRLDESQAIENNALVQYLRKIPVVSRHTSVFDQAEMYSHSSHAVFDVRASSGGVTDVSGNVHGVENQGGSCGGCTAPRELWDGRTGEVMVFDGANSMLIYQNLTTDVPHVAATRRGSGVWDSSVPLYQTVRPLAGVGGGAEQQCVVRADLFTPFVKCMLRGHYFDKPYAIVARFKPSADVSEADRTQQIFTEASVGETTVRMYANGAVVLNVLSYGCSTKPVEGGTKGGEWVSVAFVRTATNCTTFVNGKLWDTNLIVPGYKAEPHGVPFELGRGFVGEISSVQMLNVTVNAKEATGLHENDVFVRDVPSKTWLLEIGRIRREDALHTGLDWIVATMMPRDDVMRRVDENNRVMLYNLEVQEDNTKTKLQQKTNETIIVIVAIALASVFVFLVFNDLLTRPFAQVCVVMADAAVMRIEEIPDISSRILEINAIHRAMVLMSRNLREYKAYMPQSVLADTDEEDESDTNGSTMLQTSSKPSYDAQSALGSIAARSTTNRSSLGTHVALEAGTRRAGMALSLSRKKCTFLLLNLVKFHAKMSVLSERRIVATHGKVLEKVLAIVQAAKGICDGFSGDRFLSSFNALKMHASHRLAGCLAGVMLRDALKEEHGFETSSAVVSGDARVGNMGCEVMRKYTFVSPVLTWGNALERYARSLSYALLADHFVVPDAASEFVVRTVGQVVFEKRLADGKPLTISRVLQKREAGGNEEWMYVLEEMTAADPQTWNKFADCVLRKNWAVCCCPQPWVVIRVHTHTHTHTQEARACQPQPDISDVVLCRFLRAVEEEWYTPDEIVLH